MRFTAPLLGLAAIIGVHLTAASDRATDSSALYAIKEANPGWVFDTINEVLWDNINGGQFTNMWRSGNTINHWEGVTVKNDRVVALNLRESGVKTLPIAPGTLTELATLNLDKNQLLEFPADIRNLEKLTSLSLWNNQLTTIPDDLGELQLKGINLGSNKLTEIPRAVFHFAQLETLDIIGNEVSLVPPDIGSLTSLKVLKLAQNLLTELPEEIGSLTKLVTLYLWKNNLRTVPATLKNCVNMERMSLANNELEEFPFEIFENMRRFLALELNNNKLTVLPATFGYLHRAETVRLSSNALTSLPPEIANLGFLSSLYLDSNMLTTFPPEFDSLTRLTSLHADFNKIDTLAPLLFSRHTFDYLYLRGNKLRTIPLTLRVEKILALDSNCIEYLPEDPKGNDWTTYCDTLEYLYLGNNNLTTLPKNMVNLTNLGRGDADFSLNNLTEDALDSSVIVWLKEVDSDWKSTQQSNSAATSPQRSLPYKRVQCRITGSTIMFTDDTYNGLLVYLTDINGKRLASGPVTQRRGPVFTSARGVVIVRIPGKSRSIRLIAVK